jgi:hypothetical protein
MTLQPFVGPWPLFQFLDLIHIRQDIFERGISPSQGLYQHIEQHKHRLNAHRHLCLEWDSNPQSERSSERRQFMPYIARPLWSTEWTCRSMYSRPRQWLEVSGQFNAPIALPLGKEPQVPIGYEVGWTLELVWTTWRGEKSSPESKVRVYICMT